MVVFESDSGKEQLSDTYDESSFKLPIGPNHPFLINKAAFYHFSMPSFYLSINAFLFFHMIIHNIDLKIVIREIKNKEFSLTNHR